MKLILIHRHERLSPQAQTKMNRREPESITLLVFKDNFASRTFQLPLTWVSRFGLLIGALVGVSLLTAASAARFYWIARKADPVRVMDLEQELADLREALARKSLTASSSSPLPLAQNNPAAASGTVSSPLPANEAAPTTALSRSQTSTQEPPPSITRAAQPPILPLAPSQPSAQAIPQGTGLLGGELTTDAPADPNTLSFKIDQLHAHWRKEGGLEVNFNLLYQHTDGGSQRGRVIVMARGPALIQGYPAGTVASSNGKAEIRPREGEYFSVGRYREVLAEFPEIKAKSATTTIEIIIYDTNLKLLVHKLVPLGEILR